MTSAPVAPQYVDFEVPEELPKSSGRILGKIVVFGAQMPPEKRAAKVGGTPRPALHLAVDPVNFKYNSDRSLGFEDDFEHDWYELQDRNGATPKADSKLGKLKAAFAKLGYSITNGASCAALVGKYFVFEKDKETITFKKQDEQGNEVDDPRDIYTLVPVEALPDDYVHIGATPVFPRPRKSGQATSAASIADNASVAGPKLAEILNGKTEGEFFDALTESQDSDVLRAPYIVEASTDPHALAMRMVNMGLMTLQGDKLVKVGS